MESQILSPSIEETAKQAVALEEAAKEEAAKNYWQTLTIRPKTPLCLDGRTFETLTFDWTRLTGKDSLDIEEEVRILTGKGVVNAMFNNVYLACMAVRACTSTSSEGKPLHLPALQELPIALFLKICSSARNFLLIAEFASEMEETGSANNA